MTNNVYTQIILGAMTGDSIGAHVEFKQGGFSSKLLADAMAMKAGGTHGTASGQITETATSMTKAQNDAVRLQKELQDLTENLNKLNKIYVGMYDAMHK